VPDQLGVDAIHQVAEDLARDLPSDVDDEAVMNRPATPSAQWTPAAVAARPTRAPAEEMASSQECLASAINVME